MQYTDTVGQKFHQDGSVRTFAGNTVICPTAPDTNAYKLAVGIQASFAQQPFGPKFSLLPASSLHMTIIELLCDQVRKPSRWSRFLPLDATLEQQDQFFMDAVRQVPVPEHFRMRYKSIVAHVGLTIELLPVDADAEKAIWNYRSAIAEVTGVRREDFDTYQFHMSLAYKIIELESDEQNLLTAYLARVDEDLKQNFGVWETGSPELSFFDDMFRFVPIHERHTLTSR